MDQSITDQKRHEGEEIYIFRRRVGKLQSRAKSSPSLVFLNKVLLEHTPCPFIYILSVPTFKVQLQVQIVLIETSWPIKLKIFIIWS